jgi:hypothetical protein
MDTKSGGLITASYMVFIILRLLGDIFELSRETFWIS